MHVPSGKGGVDEIVKLADKMQQYRIAEQPDEESRKFKDGAGIVVLDFIDDQRELRLPLLIEITRAEGERGRKEIVHRRVHVRDRVYAVVKFAPV